MSDTIAPSSTESAETPVAETPVADNLAATGPLDEARTRFGDALAEARAGAQALGRAALERSDAWQDAATAKATDWTNEARSMIEQARDRGLDLAYEGKARASDMLVAVSKSIADTAEVIDERLGVTYGDYARLAADNLKSTAAGLEGKSFADLGDEVKAFARENPVITIGVAGLAGYLVARAFTTKAPSSEGQD